MKDIQTLREEINQADQALLEAFIKRMRVAKDIGLYKEANNLPIFDPVRERDILEKRVASAPQDLAMDVNQLYHTLFDLSRSYQQRSTSGQGALQTKILHAIDHTDPIFPKQAMVACQGAMGAYSQQACDKLFALPTMMYCKRFEGVFQAIESGLCQYGVLPIENSSHGSVTEVYDLMKKHQFSIVRSLCLKIDHCLLAKDRVDFSNIREIVSHEQAIGQCSELFKAYPDIKVTVCENTAMAAKMVSESDRNDIAAISSPSCAGLYGLRVLKRGIANSDSNFTRFICIAKQLEIYPGANKMSLLVSIAHKPGALYSLIAKCYALGINLTKLESRPIAGTDFEFLFYFDLEASVYDPNTLKLLDELQDTCTYLGSYLEI